MTRQPWHVFLVIGLNGHDEPVLRITDVLERQDIPIEVIGRGRQLQHLPSVVVRVPYRRLAEAMLALEADGFADVVAYHTGED
jgi:hypothetical protein